MTIVRLKKVALFGLLNEKQNLLSGLQALGCMHVESLARDSKEADRQPSLKSDAACKALQFLTVVKPRRKQVMRQADFNASELIRRIQSLQQQLRDTMDQCDFLKHRIQTISPWGNIEFPPLETLAGYRLWFYRLPVNQLRALQAVNLPWQIVHKDHRMAYVIVISREEPAENLLPVPRTHTGAFSLEALQIKLGETEVTLEELMAERQALTRYIYLLSINLARENDQIALDNVTSMIYDDGDIIAVQGWVPASKAADLKVFAARLNLACLIEDPAPDEAPPTLLDQPDSLAAGTDLAMFYQVPAYGTWDPSRVLFASFSLFFAMILADAGYGLVLCAGLLFFWSRLGHSSKGIHYRRLASSVFGCTIVYGVLVGSYFGVSPSPHSLPGRLHLLDLHDFDTMMALSIFIGVVHIVIANSMQAYVNRNRVLALSKLGWNFVIAGALLYWFHQSAIFNSFSLPFWEHVGLILITTGIASIVIFGGEYPVRKKSDYLWRLLLGLFSLKNLLNAFGDILSYMRLFALGLASASLAITFNDLARQAIEIFPGVGLLAAIMILLVGHALNLALSVISGVVHGLRLNFIEFFNWGLSEEGRPFKTFSRQEVDHE